MKKSSLHTFQKWLQPGIRIKRWLILLAAGLLVLGVALAQAFVVAFRGQEALPSTIYYLTLGFLPPLWRAFAAGIVGLCATAIALYELNVTILQPIAAQSSASWTDILQKHNVLQHRLHVVAIGGGTGLPSVLRGMKKITTNITAVVTMADDGGSTGRLREGMGVLPPGDLRSNLAALSDDEDMMTRLFQYRFGKGDLGGHSFGNLFLTALSDIMGNMDAAVAVAGRVLAITGRVLPVTLDSIYLGADIRTPEGRLERVYGESQIPEAKGKIERVFLQPEHVKAYPEVIAAILGADLIVIGPGSLYTSILPNLLVHGVVDALKASSAQVVYICNIAEQPGETEAYTVAEHVEALEKHIGTEVINVILANNTYPPPPKDVVTDYVQPAPDNHPLFRRYQVLMTDLTDDERPWRHDPEKLVRQLMKIRSAVEVNQQTKSLSRTA